MTVYCKFTEGSTWHTAKCGVVEILEYQNHLNIKIQFLNTGHTRYTTSKELHTKQIDDPSIPILYGRGFRGVGRHKSWIDGRITRERACWNTMFEHCYKNELNHTLEVCREWRDFQVFADWYEANYIRGHRFDITEGNKVYGPDSCCFINPHTGKPGRFPS